MEKRTVHVDRNLLDPHIHDLLHPPVPEFPKDEPRAPWYKRIFPAGHTITGPWAKKKS